MNCCPRNCRGDRKKGEGYCKAGEELVVNTYQLHYHEEPPISGTKGSGTIFFSGCNLQCVYCQNYVISYNLIGKKYTPEKLVDIMFELERAGAHNINLVNPTHYSEQILTALKIAKSKDLSIPIVWNSNGYESVEILRKLEGYVDIYMPDYRYSDGKMSLKYSGAADYPEKAQKAISEMFRQVGHLKIYEDIAYRGLLIRILVLPEDINGIEKQLEWIAENLGTKTYISLLGQYYPTAKAHLFPEINRSITIEEYYKGTRLFEKFGFENGFFQSVGSSSYYTPDFPK